MSVSIILQHRMSETLCLCLFGLCSNLEPPQEIFWIRFEV